MMDAERELIYKRRSLHRLMLAQPECNAEQLAQELGMSATCGRKGI
jgi:hypothetical protein